MAKKSPKRKTVKTVKTVKRKVPKLTPADELAGALRDVIAGSESRGGRDRPEIARAREVLAKHEK